MLLLNLWNSNQGDMKRESFVSTIFIVFLQIEGNLLKKYQCTFLKRVPSIFRINIEIVLTKDYHFMSPWLLFRKFLFPSVKPSKSVLNFWDGNARGKHPLKGSDPRGPRLESWSQWGTIIIQSIEAIEAKSGHAPALRSHPNQF